MQPDFANCWQKMVGPRANRQGGADLQAVLGLPDRRACSIVNADRKMVRYQSRRPPDTELRDQMRDLANERKRFAFALRRRRATDVRQGRGQEIAPSPRVATADAGSAYIWV